MKPRTRLALQLAVSAGALGYLLWRIDLGRAASVLGHARVLPVAITLALFLLTTWPLAWRWQLLLAAKGIEEPLSWLTKLYFVGQAASQVLPTVIGGDALRILRHARRRPDRKADVAAAVVTERATGAVATFVLAGLGTALAATNTSRVTAFVPLEVLLGIATLVVGYLLLSTRSRTLLARLAPAARRLRVERLARGLYGALHGYRTAPRTLIAVTALSFAIQVVRVLGVWLCGVAVGLHLGPTPYFILGPLLLLVSLVPITINGLGVREAFFVTFLAHYGVGASQAFAAGFLYFAVTVAAAVPGVAFLAAGEGFRLDRRVAASP